VARVKIEDLKPEARELDGKEMKKLLGGLYRIDLSGVANQYIVDTEKNLNIVLEAAETSNQIVFFDEADDLFGKR
jgi:hypothetical protein